MQTSFREGSESCSLKINGDIARANTAMASGCPCVVPSDDHSVLSPLTNSGIGAGYMFWSAHEMAGHTCMLCRAAFQFKEVTFVASTIKRASVLSE